MNTSPGFALSWPTSTYTIPPVLAIPRSIEANWPPGTPGIIPDALKADPKLSNTLFELTTVPLTPLVVTIVGLNGRERSLGGSTIGLNGIRMSPTSTASPQL